MNTPDKQVIVIDRERCTGCEICSTACLSKAIERNIAEDKLKISLNYAKCNFCGECEALCPEKAITIKPGLASGEGFVSLFEDELLKCSQCGKPFAPKSLINRFKNILKTRQGIPETLDLCLNCKQLANSRKFLERISARRGGSPAS